MATSLKSRIIVKEHTGAGTIEGSYKLLLKAKTIPSPIKDPNTVESTNLEDEAQTFEMGIFQSGSISAEGNMERSYMKSIGALNGKKVDIMHLYGTDGLGGVGKYAYAAQVVAKPNDVGGNDEILGMTAVIVPNSVPKDVTDEYTVTVTGEEDSLSFTVTKKATNLTNDKQGV